MMKEAESLNVRERSERLLPILEQAFHVPLMARIASRPH